jgi:hypothetical protein
MFITKLWHLKYKLIIEFTFASQKIAIVTQNMHLPLNFICHTTKIGIFFVSFELFKI